jgi:GNAT superfamily N-acetyltransferase
VISEHVSVRQAGEDDLMSLAALRRLWSEEQDGHPLDDDDFDDQFAQWFMSEATRRVTFLAAIDGQVVGRMNLAIFERMPRPARAASRWGYLGNAFVLTNHRDGVGRALLEALVDAARDQGCVRIVLSPSERSVPFYERAGFGPASMLMARVLTE